MTIEIRELLIQAKVTPSATGSSLASSDSPSLLQQNQEIERWVDKIKNEVLEALRDNGREWQ